MVPEQPPRRSKSDKEPVTIDLTAEPSVEQPAEPAPETSAEAPTPSDVMAEPVRSNDTDEASAGEPETAAAPEEQLKYDEPEAQPSQQDAPPETKSAAAEPSVAPASRRNAPATSTLVAAGIFGGIVALLLAGSMQYAGYLPGATRTPATSDLSLLSGQIASLQAEIRDLGNRPPAPDAAVANRVAALEKLVSQGGSDELSQRLAVLEREINNAKSATATTAANDADLGRRLAQAEQKINDRGPEQEVARAVTAAALKGAIDRGGPFDAELQTYATSAADDPAVAELKPFAATGVPSRAELQREFPRIADAMLDAVNSPDPDQGITSRLLASALSVVKVRRVGDVQGDAPEAIVARIEEGLRNGDLKATAQQWASLPEPAKAASQNFKQKLDARIQVEDLVGGTLARAISKTQG